ncbi:hypothetical protein EYZ11_000374 [Aspergillus tanneri]|uniref:Uncharacterized protein n=1 Tax=Aspergillus tanneri TaxID=1220188 RepID=A0A4S3JXD7_9EURO|nr:hypothetical protein EYZ11_000374 [Aspergillus tanneri]
MVGRGIGNGKLHGGRSTFWRTRTKLSKLRVDFMKPLTIPDPIEMISVLKHHNEQIFPGSHSFTREMDGSQQT